MPRPKEFDPDDALQRAMGLFWQKGYAATSIRDLVTHLGINRFSLYSTFGGKHELFLKALGRYRRDHVLPRLRALESEGLRGVEKYFADTVDYLASGDGWRGCLMTNSAVELGSRDRKAAGEIRSHFESMEVSFRRALLEARKKGEIGAGVDPGPAARYLTTVAQGLGVIAKTRPERKHLERTVRLALSTLEG